MYLAYRRMLMFGLMLVLTGLFCTSCSDDDDITQPPVVVEPTDEVAGKFLMSIFDQDPQEYATLLSDDFKAILSVSDTSVFNLPSDYLTKAEFIEASTNLMSGNEIENFQGVDCGPLSGIDNMEWSPLDDAWSLEPATSDFPDHLSRRFQLSMGLSLPGPVASYGVDEILHLYLEAQVAGEDTTYTLGGLREDLGSKATIAAIGWAGLCAHFLTVDGPTAALTLEDMATYPAASVSCDASASVDETHGLNAAAYRWRFDDEPWTDWGADATTTYACETAGTKTVSVEVRNRWLVSDVAEEIINIEVGMATTLTQLMVNFKAMYETQNTELIDTTLSGSFNMILQQETIDDFGLAEGRFVYEEMEFILGNIFSGEDIQGLYGLVPGVASISFSTWEQQEAWAPAPLADPNFSGHMSTSYLFRTQLSRPGHTYLVAQGLLKVYAIQETPESAWALSGIVDLTDTKTKATESISFGSIHALYR